MGTCPDMCPAREERAQRERLRDLAVLELVDGAQRERLRDLAVLERVDGDTTRTVPSLTVKKGDPCVSKHGWNW